ncbi:MAG: translation initiation factor IF-2 subunit alpha [archaeon]
MKKTGWPKENELVIVKVKRIMDYGAIADLIEYENRDGFIHISNLTKSWVKNIRSHVSIGERRVAEVLKVNKDERTINLSVKDVTGTQIKRKMNQWKREKRTDKIIGKLAKDLEEDPKEAKEEIIPKIVEEYGEGYLVFEEAAASGKEAFKGIDIPEKWKKKITEYAEENVKPPEVTIEGIFKISTLEGKGVEIIKKALKPVEEENVKMEYVSAPKYKIKITARDYEIAEEKLEKAKEKINESMEGKGKVEFQRKKD